MNKIEQIKELTEELESANAVIARMCDIQLQLNQTIQELDNELTTYKTGYFDYRDMYCALSAEYVNYRDDCNTEKAQLETKIDFLTQDLKEANAEVERKDQQLQCALDHRFFLFHDLKHISMYLKDLINARSDWYKAESTFFDMLIRLCDNQPQEVIDDYNQRMQDAYEEFKQQYDELMQYESGINAAECEEAPASEI